MSKGHPKHLAIADFSYELPEDRIAKFPAAQRDASRLLVFRQGQMEIAPFKTLPEQLPSESLLVFNQTKVVHARLLFQKETGGKIEIFCLEPDQKYGDMQMAMAQKKEVLWHCMVGGASKWKAGQVLILRIDTLCVFARLVQKNAADYTLHFSWEPEELAFAAVLEKAGQLPLPPYLNREVIEKDEVDYQTIFAKDEGSVAAPTAALHFSPEVVEALTRQGTAQEQITLHVGAGTFLPVKSADMQGHAMHAEALEIDLSFLQRLKDAVAQGKCIIAVGTTSCRTLESLYWIGYQCAQGIDFRAQDFAVPQWFPYEQNTALPASDALAALIRQLELDGLDKLICKTQIIIAPSYQFRVVKGLITNFHQPQSTLLLLVAALVGPAWKKLYQHALDNGFRFLSYGDSSLLLPNLNVKNCSKPQ